MRQVHLYITSSIDGFISRLDGSVDWLFEEGDYGVMDFVKTIDCAVMGGATYRQVLTFGEWPYKDLKSYVITRDRTLSSEEDIQFVTEQPVEFFHNLKKKKGKDIWLIGGGEINSLFIREGLLDKISWYIQPIVLGQGIPLFAPSQIEEWFQVESVKSFPDGMVEVIYLKK